MDFKAEIEEVGNYKSRIVSNILDISQISQQKSDFYEMDLTLDLISHQKNILHGKTRIRHNITYEKKSNLIQVTFVDGESVSFQFAKKTKDPKNVAKL